MITNIHSLPKEIFCEITQYLNLPMVFKLKEVCKEFSSIISKNESTAIADTLQNRIFVAKLIFNETGRTDELMAIKTIEKIVEGYKNVVMLQSPIMSMKEERPIEFKKDELQNFLTNHFKENVIPQMMKTFTDNMTVNELFEYLRFSKTSAGKKQMSLIEKESILMQNVMRDLNSTVEMNRFFTL